MLSYWEQQSFLHYDHIIIGSGIIGLSHAIELRERSAKASVLVLERGLLPTGASTRNAGFACTGSVTELLDDLTVSTQEEVVALFARRQHGLAKLRKRLGDDNIHYREHGSHELITAAESDALNSIDMLNDMLRPLLGRNNFAVASKQRIKEFGFNENIVEALVSSSAEGELNSGAMMRALWQLATEKGVLIMTGAEVLSFEEGAHQVTVQAKDVARKSMLNLKARTISICTNAFTRALLPDAAVVPGRGQVLITEAIDNLSLKGIFHLNHGYYYFRELHGRVLLGGGRNLDFDGETTTDILLNDRIQQDLEEKLRTVILPGKDFSIAQRWSGIMAFGETGKVPVIKAFSQRVFGAFRCGGMGVALGSGSAAQLADIITEYHPA